MNEFNYEEKVEKIKSALFDLYEQEEYHISQVEDLKERDSEYRKYAALKDKAADLLSEIEKLYNVSEIKEQKETPTVEEPEEKISNTKEDAPLEIENNEEVTNDTDNEDQSTEISTDDIKENRYYLDGSNTAPNFAYIPEKLLERLKRNGNSNKNNFYKQDDLDTKGIIVRPDQFMKLSLSRNRQEGVLREAKLYRINLATKSREQLSQIGGENESEQ